METWIIYDWAGNIVKDIAFKSFDDAECYLCEFFEANGMDYETERGEYYIEQDSYRVIK